MNDLIKVNYTESEQPTVSGRELHEALEVKTAYKDWFPRMCEYGFTEGEDFCSFLSESTGGRPSTDHQLTIPMPKTTLYRSLRQLEDSGEIKSERQRNSKYTVFTVKNYMEYQGSGTKMERKRNANGTEMERKWNASGTDTIYKNNKNIKNIKKERNIPPSGEISETPIFVEEEVMEI